MINNISTIAQKPTTEEAKEALCLLLRYIGENPNRPGLLDTPDRILRMYREIYRGYDPQSRPQLTVFDNATDDVAYTGVISDTGTFHSVCEHHMMPFFGHYALGYIPHPQGKILGISKIGRTVDYCAARLQIQERLAQDIVKMINSALGTTHPPLAIGIILEGQHLCKSMRGVKKSGHMRTTYYLGDPAAIQELKMELTALMPTKTM